MQTTLTLPDCSGGYGSPRGPLARWFLLAMLALWVVGFLSVLAAHGQEPAAPANKVTGLELPEPFAVTYQPGKLISVQAKTTGKVGWYLSTAPHVDLDQCGSGNWVRMPMPPAGTVITVIAAANLSGEELPALVSTTVTVKGGDTPPPPPPPGPPKPPTPPPPGPMPPAAGTVKFATIVYAQDGLVPDVASLKDSATLKKGAADRGVRLRALDKDAAEAGPQGTNVKRFYDQNSAPVLVLQDAKGTVVLPVYKLTTKPNDQAGNEAAILAAVDAANGPKP